MMNPFKNVEVNKPPKITVAIGLWISFPGRSPFNANRDQRQGGTQRRHQDRVQTSREPCITDSRNPIPSPRKCV